VVEILIYVGIGVFIIGGIAFLVAAFRTSLLWGLACLLIAPISIIYLFVHWSDAKKPFLIQVFGVAIIIFSAYTQGLIPPISASSVFVGSPVISNQQFKCDGRTHCSQMTSCAEATYFLRNCPNTKMDGNNDGIPCEQQWCR
jgi:hypothetical protein